MRGKGRRGVLGGQTSGPHGAKIRSSSFVLLRRLGRRALRLAVLSGGGFAAPGGVVAQGRGAVEVVLVVQAVGGVVLRVLQAGDQTLILVAELAAHQGRLAHDHHVLDGETKGANFTAAKNQHQLKLTRDKQIEHFIIITSRQRTFLKKCLYILLYKKEQNNIPVFVLIEPLF